MKPWLKLFLFLLAFQLEVRVRASDAAVIESPEHCLTSSETCAVKAQGFAFHFDKEKSKFHATKGSVIERNNSKEWKLIAGQLWVESAPGVVFSTIYGSAKASHGEYWISSTEDKIFFRNISADLEVTLRDGQTVRAPAGFQFWISGLNSDAKSEYGMIEPVDMKTLLPVWNAVFVGKKSDFVTKIKKLRADWGNLVEVSSEIYREQTLRKIASIEEQKKNTSDRLRKVQMEKERLREAYRARVFDR